MARILLLPTFMGTALHQGPQPIWLDMQALRWGDFILLAADRPDIRPTGLLPAYQPLIDRLGTLGEPIPVATDWRDSFLQQQTALAEALNALLPQPDPIHIVAHGSGTLLLHALHALYPELLDAWLNHHPDNRMIWLGPPPLNGRFDMIQLLTGRHRLIRLLAHLTPGAEAETILAQQFAQYPGVLDLLPPAFLRPKTWKRLLSDAPLRLDPTLLQEAAERRARYAHPLPDALRRRCWLILGQAPLTPCDIQDEALLATPAGDGVSPHPAADDPAMPPAERRLHLQMEQGRLITAPTLAEWIDRCLHDRITGTSTPDTGEAHCRTRLPPLHKTPQPDEEELTAAALGYHTLNTREEVLPPVRLHIQHGDLRYSDAPVMVGHYRGDGLFNAEKALDAALGGRLRLHHRLGAYPGPLESFRLFTAPDSRPPGALVVGLGEIGDLTGRALQRSLRAALLDYALQQAPPADETLDAVTLTPLTLGTLLIGTGGRSGLTLEEALRALLRAIQSVNATLCKSGRVPLPRLAHIRLIERYEDRALEAAHTLHRLLQLDEFRTAFTLAETIESLPGGQQRLMHEEGSDWWQRLQIEGHDDGTLSYRMLTERARVEMQLQATQRALVDRFIGTALSTLQDDREIGRTLFELLLPLPLRDRFQTLDALVLLLNRRAAHYPWELLQDPRDQRDIPLVVQTGLIRQLQLPDYRETVRHPVQRTALVIGDPLTDRLPKLDAAEAEATALSQQLTEAGFQVTSEIRTDAGSIIRALHRQPWRVLHLAGHGLFRHAENENDPPVTGLALSDGLFLTAAEIRQMRQPPELVFINACYLGQLNPDMRGRQHLLAASLSEALIGMGVRAVVAAGWAVDDKAAALFARTFYQQMLLGRPFGEAVRIARRQTWKRYPHTNTWGAYQCYGDPDYRLVHQVRASDRPLLPAHSRRPYFCAEEVRVALDNLCHRRPHMTHGEAMDALRRLMQDARSWFTTTPALQCQLARCWLRLGEAEQALALWPDAASIRRDLTAEHDRLDALLTAASHRLLTGSRPTEPEAPTLDTLLAEAQTLLQRLTTVSKTLATVPDGRLLLDGARYLQLYSLHQTAEDDASRLAARIERLAHAAERTETPSPTACLIRIGTRLLRHRRGWLQKLARRPLITCLNDLDETAGMATCPWLHPWRSLLLALLAQSSLDEATSHTLIRQHDLIHRERPLPLHTRHYALQLAWLAHWLPDDGWRSLLQTLRQQIERF